MSTAALERDLFTDAKRLLNEGLHEAAVVTARVALERSLRRILDINNDPEERDRMVGCRRLTRVLRDRKRIGLTLQTEVNELNNLLSRIAHGLETTPHECSRLIDRSNACLGKIQAAHNRVVRKLELRQAKRDRDRRIAAMLREVH